MRVVTVTAELDSMSPQDGSRLFTYQKWDGRYDLEPAQDVTVTLDNTTWRGLGSPDAVVVQISLPSEVKGEG